MATATRPRRGFTCSPPLLDRMWRHKRLARSTLSAIDRSTTSLPRKKSVEMMFACCRHLVDRRAVTLRLTASAFSLREPRRNRMSSTVGVVCAMAEWSGERALGCGDVAIAWSKYSNSAVGLLVLAHRCGSTGQSQLFSAKFTKELKYYAYLKGNFSC